MARMNKYEREVAEKEQKRLREKERKEREPTVGGSIMAGIRKVTGTEEASAAPKYGNGKKNGRTTQTDPGEYYSGKKFDEPRKKVLKETGAEPED